MVAEVLEVRLVTVVVVLPVAVSEVVALDVDEAEELDVVVVDRVVVVEVDVTVMDCEELVLEEVALWVTVEDVESVLLLVAVTDADVAEDEPRILLQP